MNNLIHSEGDLAALGLATYPVENLQQHCAPRGTGKVPKQDPHDHDHDRTILTRAQRSEIEDFSEWLDEIVPDQFWSDVKPPDGLSDDEQESWDMMWDAATILRTQGYSPTLLRDFFDTVVTAILVWESEN